MRSNRKKKEKEKERNQIGMNGMNLIDSSCSDETKKLCSSVSDSSSVVHHTKYKG